MHAHRTYTSTNTGSILAVGTGSGAIEFWQTNHTQKPAVLLHEFEAHASYITSCAFSPDGACLATGGDDGTFKFWKVPPASQLLQLRLRQEEKGHQPSPSRAHLQHLLDGSHDQVSRTGVREAGSSMLDQSFSQDVSLAWDPTNGSFGSIGVFNGGGQLGEFEAASSASSTGPSYYQDDYGGLQNNSAAAYAQSINSSISTSARGQGLNMPPTPRAAAAAAAGGSGGGDGGHSDGVSSSERLRSLQALKEKRKADLVREKQTIKALQIAVATKQKEIDASTRSHFEEMAKKLTRQQHRLPLWGLNAGAAGAEHDADLQFLSDLRERRDALYKKVGRPDGIGTRRTYLATYELHPQDLERQQIWEDGLSGATRA